MSAEKKRNILIVLMLCLCSGMGMLLTTARAVILVTLLKGLGGYQYYSMVVLLTPMFLAVTLPIAGKISSITGKKRVLLAGIAGYGLSSAVCGLAGSVWIFMFGIAFVGISYGFMCSVVFAIIADIFEARLRPKFNSYTAVANAAASIVGPVLGGLLADTAGWRWVYFLIIPLSLTALILAARYLPNDTGTSDRHFDWKGMSVFLACLIPFLYALSMGGKTHAWNSPVIILCFVLAALMLAALIVIERKERMPVIPWRLFFNPGFSKSVALCALATGAFAAINYVTVYYQSVRGMSPTASGFLISPREIAEILASYAAGRLLVGGAKFKKISSAYYLIFSLSLLTMCFYVSKTPIWVIVAAEVCFGAGYGGQSVSIMSYAQTTLSPEQMAGGLAFINFSGMLATSVGVALGGCMINQVTDLSFGLRLAFLCYFTAMLIALILAAVRKWPQEAPQAHT